MDGDPSALVLVAVLPEPLYCHLGPLSESLASSYAEVDGVVSMPIDGAVLIRPPSRHLCSGGTLVSSRMTSTVGMEGAVSIGALSGDTPPAFQSKAGRTRFRSRVATLDGCKTLASPAEKCSLVPTSDAAGRRKLPAGPF